jgi:hypothetical protein
MSIFGNLFGKKPVANEQAVIVKLDGVGLPDSVYEECDLATIEDRLIAVIKEKKLGKFDGNEVGEKYTTLYMYAPDAEKLFAGVEAVLRDYPLCQGAEVTIRWGKPGAPERKITIKNA